MSFRLLATHVTNVYILLKEVDVIDAFSPLMTRITIASHVNIRLQAPTVISACILSQVQTATNVRENSLVLIVMCAREAMRCRIV